jgi:quinone-modifying oxidoreductase subunit QmoB
MANKKVGAYICSGCSIAGAVDVEQLAALGAEAGCLVRKSPAFCLEDSRLIRDDVAEGAVEAVVVAACSPRVNTDVFRIPGATVERVNLREQVAWSHPAGHPETQELALDYLRMGIMRAQRVARPQPYTQANTRAVLVIGGGIAGISAALNAARCGFRVVVVEKQEELGGWANRLYRQFPKRFPYRGLPPITVVEQVRELRALPNVAIHCGSSVESIEGEPGRFKVTLRTAQGTVEDTVGAIIAATGWQPVATEKYERYGLGVYPNVTTSVALEEMAKRGVVARPSDGGPARRVLFLLCDGRGDDAHLPYGGNVSSLVALKQALYVRELNPEALAYLFYGDIQTPGQYEYFYHAVQADPGVLLSQGQVERISETHDHSLAVELSGTTLGPGTALEVDLVVLASGMAPNTATSDGALALRYLQGQELPVTKFGFADSNFICFPYETRRTGIYSAGAARQAMDLAAAARDGRAAALKAMQSIEKSSAGQAVHPRVGDMSYPGFFMQKCTSCGRCTQECPFGALELNEKRNPVLNPNRCRRCGICMGACPVQIISFADYSVDILSAMIKSVEIPEADGEKPRILALACENDAYPALDMAGINRLEYPASIRVLPVRCIGSVNSVLVTDAVSRGFDGVALLGCKSGEDYQCHFIHGSELLEKRMANMRETLGRLMLEPERVQVVEVAIADYAQLPSVLNKLADAINEVGPNPMKGF